MTYTIIISLLLHMIVFIYMIFGGNPGAREAYPRIMTVDLVSMPPISKGVPGGVETPGKPETKTVKAKPQSKVESKAKSPHLAEVNKKKRQTEKPSETKAESSKPGIDDDRLGLPEGVEFGSEFGTVQLEGASFETPTYLNILFAKIKYRWDNPFQGIEKIACTIYFTILRNGDVVDVTIELSSGVAAFDQSALRAILSSKPPPLPLEYIGNQLGIHLQFQYIP